MPGTTAVPTLPRCPRAATGPRPASGTQGARPTLHLDRAAVTANVRTIRAQTGSRVMAVVKANGFGLGTVPVARAALDGGASWLGVTDLDDAELLRRAGLTAPVLAWLHPGGLDVEQAVRARTDLAVGLVEELQQVVDQAPGLVRVHLHLDTGMARGGVPRAEWPALMRLARRAQDGGHLRVVGLMGHLPEADRADPERNAPGVEAFAVGLRLAVSWGLWPLLTHLGATAAALTDPATRFEMVRIGAGLVGIDPSSTTQLRAAGRLTAPVTHAAEVPAGTRVGYGGTHVTTSATHLSVLGLGYVDGLPRELSPDAAVEIGGRRHRVVGRVSMDQMVIDTGAISYPRGTLATVFGPAGTAAPTVQEWAAWAGTIPHVILAGIGSRVRRTVA
ncbi:alanine racemase [Bogoriella caseilytica]|uniref:Alanine racemase n=1 Tax=Bogoriella caseilytica TaxID=56055 RepID=A0A3N2BGI6_9MICO|nr:alanine racemase [Bogoriella caseilytica]ROR74376.1 alanine racemase [Bogoriella caseilytica]